MPRAGGGGRAASQTAEARPPTLGDVSRRFVHHSDPRRTTGAVAALLGLLLVLGAFSAVFHQHKALWIVTLFDASRGQAIPPLVSGAFLVAAGLLVGGAAEGRTKLRVTRWLLLVLGVDEAIGLHDTVQAQTGIAAAALWLPLVAVAAGAFALSLASLRPSRASALFAAGALLWLAAQALELRLGADPHDAARYVKEAVELAGGAVLFLASLLVLRRVAAPPRSSGLRPGEELVAALPFRRVTAVVAAVIAALVVLALVAEVGEVDAHVFRMNNELTWPAFFSAGLFVGSALLSFLLARLWRGDRWAGRGARMLGVVFAVLAVDELLAIHEALGRATAAVDEGQLFLIPVVPFAALGWLAVSRGLREELLGLWVGGALCWMGAVSIDTFHPPLTAAGSVLLEDTLELCGTSCFLLALLGAAQREVAHGTRASAA